MTNLTKLFFASLFTLHACAHVWEAPAQTVHAYDEADPWEWTPAPTAAPGPLELVKRQNPFRSVCGYVNGNQCKSQPATRQMAQVAHADLHQRIH